MEKIVLIRMDRIGDLVLTMPVDQVLPDCEVSWIVSKGVEFVPQLAVPSRKFLSFQKKFSFVDFFKFLGVMLSQKPAAAVIFHAPWWVSFAIWLAGIPIRAGVRSQWHSYIFLNKTLRQKRSRAEKHEAEYNLELLESVLNLTNTKLKDLAPLVLNSKLEPHELQRWGLGSKKYIVVHPGMGGSALNWSTLKYVELIQKISNSERVVITGGPMDSQYIDPIKQTVFQTGQILFLDKKLNVHELLLVLQHAKAVLAPSTGVVHLAASLGTPTVGIYSSVLVERAARWGPRGRRVVTVSPDLQMTGQHKQDMMDHIQVDDVIREIKKIMETSQKKHNEKD